MNTTDFAQPDTESSDRKPVILCILDGWGESDEVESNAIALADTPNWDRFVKAYPKATLDASAQKVGLPQGQMGNSEVGHMTLGSGRVVLQDLPRIDEVISHGGLKENEVFQKFLNQMLDSGGRAHIMGLLSAGGVHSHQGHLVALVRSLAGAGVPVSIHAFLDGRDAPQKSAKKYMEAFEASIEDLEDVEIVTVSGRYYAMDRDKRWGRVQQCYKAMVSGRGIAAPDPMTAINDAYEDGSSDEFVEPTVIGYYRGMDDGDGLLMANFRADRAREMMSALVSPDFDGFPRPKNIHFAAKAGMMFYGDDLKGMYDPLFPHVDLKNVLAEVLDDCDKTQLHIAETEKYAHVTFFFNGGREAPYEKETRVLIPSPRVATYDLKPEMSADEVTFRLIRGIDKNLYDFIVVNYANGDMVGHSGKLGPAIQACEAVDKELGKLEEAVKRCGGTMIVTADHGNVEKMCDGSEPHTAHTLNLVPVVLVNAPEWVKGLHHGGLADVAPTILRLMDLPQPAEMGGQSLIDEDGSAVRVSAG